MRIFSILTIVPIVAAIWPRTAPGIDADDPEIPNCEGSEHACTVAVGAHPHLTSCSATRIRGSDVKANTLCCDRRISDMSISEVRTAVAQQAVAQIRADGVLQRGPFTCACADGRFIKERREGHYNKFDCVTEEEIERPLALVVAPDNFGTSVWSWLKFRSSKATVFPVRYICIDAAATNTEL